MEEECFSFAVPKAMLESNDCWRWVRREEEKRERRSGRNEGKK
jgi:hypothetical protein